MEQETDQDKALRSYLLGTLTLQEQELLEQRLLADSGAFQQLLFMEEDLIADYLSGELSAEERARFEEHFLAAPERQQDLRFAKALRKYAASSTAKKKSPDSPPWFSTFGPFFASLVPQRPAVGFSLALILVLLIVGGFWFVRRTQLTSTQPQQAGARRPPTDPEQPPGPKLSSNQNQVDANKQANLPVETPVENRPQSPEIATNSTPRKTLIFSIVLTSGSVREGGGMKTVELPQNATAARLQLEIDPAASEYQRYSALLENRSGEKISSRNNLRALTTARGKIVTWEIPAKLLKAEDYYLKLRGQNAGGQSEAVAAYSFRVVE